MSTATDLRAIFLDGQRTTIQHEHEIQKNMNEHDIKKQAVINTATEQFRSLLETHFESISEGGAGRIHRRRSADRAEGQGLVCGRVGQPRARADDQREVRLERSIQGRERNDDRPVASQAGPRRGGQLVNTLRRALGWIGERIMIAIFAVAMLLIWPFVRRTESQLKDDAQNDN
jgi:hypothetical protein